MKNQRNRWIIAGVLLLITLLVSGFVLMQPSAKDILVEAIETSKTIQNGHAIVSVTVDTVDESSSGTVEVWAQLGEDGPGAFRIAVLESSKPEANDAVIVSNGESLWAYSPAQNKAFVGTLDEVKALMADKEKFGGERRKELQDGLEGSKEKIARGEFDNAEEFVDKLLEYFKIARAGTDSLAGESTDKLKLEPIPDQMPDGYLAVGGLANVWFSQVSGLPLAIEYTGGTFGEVNLTALKYDVNLDLDPSLFTFDVPAGAEMINFEDFEPESLTLDEAKNAGEGALLTPKDTPPGATLVDIIEVRGAIVQRYTLPNGGSFTIAQGEFAEFADSIKEPAQDSETVTVRGSEATLYESEDRDQILLSWREGDRFFVVGGKLGSAEALAIAESLE